MQGSPRLHLVVAAATLWAIASTAPLSAVGPSAVMFYGGNLAQPLVVFPGNPSLTPTEFLWNPANGRVNAGTSGAGIVLQKLESRRYVSMAIFWGRLRDPDTLKASDASQHGRIYLPTGSEPAVVVVTAARMANAGNPTASPEGIPVPASLDEFVGAWALTAEQTARLRELGLPGELLAASARGQAPQPTLPLTPLEAFAAQSGTRTAWSKFVTRLDGGSASAIVTAVAFVNDTVAPRMMRGVRIELRHEGAQPRCDLKHVEWAVLCARENAAVYVEEDRLDSFRAEILRGSAYIRPGHPSGVARFSGGSGSGTLIGGYLLYNVTVDDVASSLVDASVQLKRAPR